MIGQSRVAMGRGPKVLPVRVERATLNTSMAEAFGVEPIPLKGITRLYALPVGAQAILLK